MSELGFFPAFFSAVSAKWVVCFLSLMHFVTMCACMGRRGLQVCWLRFSLPLCAFSPVRIVSAPTVDTVIMYTVFAELPGGSGALFSNLVSGAILLTVCAPRMSHSLHVSFWLTPPSPHPPPHPAPCVLAFLLQLLNIVLLFASFSRLRFSEPELDRPYRVPLIGRRTSVRLSAHAQSFASALASQSAAQCSRLSHSSGVGGGYSAGIFRVFVRYASFNSNKTQARFFEAICKRARFAPDRRAGTAPQLSLITCASAVALSCFFLPACEQCLCTLYRPVTFLAPLFDALASMPPMI